MPSWTLRSSTSRKQTNVSGQTPCVWTMCEQLFELWWVMRLTPAAAAAAGWPQEKRGWPQSVPARTSRIRSDAAADKRLHERHGRPPRPAGPASCDRTERSDCPAERRAHTAALWIHEHRVNIQNYSEMCSYQSVWITVDMGRDQALFYSLNINSAPALIIQSISHSFN